MRHPCFLSICFLLLDLNIKRAIVSSHLQLKQFDQQMSTEKTNLSKVNVFEKSQLFTEHWTPKIIGQLNGQHVKLAKLFGEFGWHSHKDEDELFYVLKGEVVIQLRNNEHGNIHLQQGEMFIVPRGVEHNPKTDSAECLVMLFEPASTINTGDQRNEKTKLELEQI